MADQEHVAILRQGVARWNQWRRENRRVKPDVSEADLEEVKLSRANLTGADLERARLSRANLFGANLEGAKLSWTNLTGARLTGADLTGARLTEADLREAKLEGADLTEAKLEGATLIRATLSRAKLSRAKLSRANLFGANLFGANLEGANFEGANFEGANLEGANLEGANLRRAGFRAANLSGARLSGANFSEAYFGDTTVTAVDLRDVQGLETVAHRGPSSIGIDTLYLSGGHIPEPFLRGCGVPQPVMENLHALIGALRPIDYYSCFISYSSQDEALAERLHADLQVAGVRCWYAPHDLEIGEPILSGIDRGIRLHDKLLLILSSASVESAWIEQEVHMALARERNERRSVLFPIRIDDSVSAQTAGWPALVWNQRHVGDFCKWKDHDAYQEAFKRVLRDLTTKTDPPPTT